MSVEEQRAEIAKIREGKVPYTTVKKSSVVTSPTKSSETLETPVSVETSEVKSSTKQVQGVTLQFAKMIKNNCSNSTKNNRSTKHIKEVLDILRNYVGREFNPQLVSIENNNRVKIYEVAPVVSALKKIGYVKRLDQKRYIFNMTLPTADTASEIITPKVIDSSSSSQEVSDRLKLLELRWEERENRRANNFWSRLHNGIKAFKKSLLND